MKLQAYITTLVSGTLLSVLLLSCEKPLPLYDTSAKGMVFFDKSLPGAPTEFQTYSFVFAKIDQTEDVIWYPVSLIGGISDHKRYIRLEQVFPTEEEKKQQEEEAKKAGSEAPKTREAQAGVHFVPFDDPFYKDKLFIDADSIHGRIPIKILRSPDLKNEEGNVKLTFRIVESDDFAPGYGNAITRTISLSDKLVRPTNWSAGVVKYYFGEWGAEKHRLMISATGEHWDEQYIRDNKFDKYDCDQEYVQSLLQHCVTALANLNAERKKEGKGPLMETEGTDKGKPVSFKGGL